MQFKENKASNTVTLGTELTAYEAPDLKEAMLKTITDNKDLNINCSDISTMDSIGCQLLVSCELTFIAAGKSMKIKNSSDSANDVFKRLGLTQFMNKAA